MKLEVDLSEKEFNRLHSFCLKLDSKVESLDRALNTMTHDETIKIVSALRQIGDAMTIEVNKGRCL